MTIGLIEVFTARSLALFGMDTFFYLRSVEKQKTFFPKLRSLKLSRVRGYLVA